MMARVSRTAREYFGGFSGFRRSRKGRYSARVRKRQPEASWISSTGRSAHSSRNSSSSLRRVSVDSSSSNIFFISLGVIGSRAASSAASSTPVTWLGSTVMHSDVNGLKGFGLGDFDQFFAAQFEHGDEMHDQAGDAHGRVEQGFELDEAALLLQGAQDDAHVLAHRQLLATDLVMLLQAGLADDGHPGSLQVVDRDLRLTNQQRFLDQSIDPEKFPLSLRHFVQLLASQLHLLVFHQPTDQFGARIFRLVALALLRPRH